MTKKEVATWRKFHVIVIGSILLSIPLAILMPIVLPIMANALENYNFELINYWYSIVFWILLVLVIVSLIEAFIKIKREKKEEKLAESQSN